MTATPIVLAIFFFSSQNPNNHQTVDTWLPRIYETAEECFADGDRLGKLLWEYPELLPAGTDNYFMTCAEHQGLVKANGT
jgi:hypothetical protein